MPEQQRSRSPQARPGRRRLLWGVLGSLLFLVVAAGTAAALVLQTSVGDLSIQALQSDDDGGDGDQAEADAEPGGAQTGNGASDDDDGEPAVEPLDEVTNVLLVGIDGRQRLDEEDAQQHGRADGDISRADTVMIAQLRPDHEDVQLLSVPRDLRVELCTGRVDKLNAAYANGELSDRSTGPECLVETVSAVTGVELDHYAQVDFAGFIDIVDELGGVTIELDEPIRDERAKVDFPAGEVRMDGSDALGFVRVRRIDNDFGRMERQQQFLAAMVDEVASVGMLADPGRLLRTFRASQDAVEADEDLTYDQLRRMAMAFRSGDAESLRTATVPGEITTIDGVSYVVLDEEGAEPLFRALRQGRSLPGTDADEDDADEDDERDERDAGSREADQQPDPDGTGPSDQGEPSDAGEPSASGAAGDPGATSDRARTGRLAVPS